MLNVEYGVGTSWLTKVAKFEDNQVITFHWRASLLITREYTDHQRVPIYAQN